MAKQRVSGITFRFMGAGEYLDAVRSLAASIGVGDCVHHVGFVPFDQMIEEILLADVCVVAVKRSAYSALVHTNKMYEYMALERPVIASRLDAVAAYAPPDALLYFSPGDASELADQLAWAAVNPDDLARRVARAGAIYDALRWEREKLRYLAAYDFPA